MKVQFKLIKADVWIGAFWDKNKRRLYICLIPCLAIIFHFKHPPVIWQSWKVDCSIINGVIREWEELKSHMMISSLARLQERTGKSYRLADYKCGEEGRDFERMQQTFAIKFELS